MRRKAPVPFLDLLINDGTMHEADFGEWLCEQGYDAHQNTIFGDRKSIEHYVALNNDIKKRGHSLSGSDEQHRGK